MRRFSVLAVVLLSSALAHAATPTLEIVVSADGFATIHPTLAAGTPYEFEITAAKTLRINWVEGNRPRHADLGAAPKVTLAVTPGPSPVPPGPTPTPPVPDPVPVPTPPTPPNPANAIATQMIVVFQAGGTSPWASPDVVSAAKLANISILAFDRAHSKDLPNAPGWMAYTAAKTLPYAGLVDDAGKIVWEGKADSMATLTAALKAFGTKAAAGASLNPLKKTGHWERSCVNGNCSNIWVED